MILLDSSLVLVDNNSSAMTAVGETTAYFIQNGYRIVAYTDSDLNAIVAINDSTIDNNWDRAIVGSNLNDAHNSISVGVDSDGYIHTVHDIHNALSFAGHYNVSSQPYDVSEMVESEIQGAAVAFVSYARFYRAGDILYLLFRVGSSGSGDEWLKRYDTTTRTWFDVAIPLIAGSTLSPPDNPYMGSCVGDDSGNLHLIWTHRVDLYNERIYYAKYEGSTGLVKDVTGAVIPLPLSRNSPIQSITSPTDQTIGNNGIGLVLDLSTPHVVFNSREKSGYPEVFYSHYSFVTNKWESVQLSNLSLPRLRACPGGPQEPESLPRPCDFELQGPFIVRDTSTLYVFYARSIGTTNPAWQRPAGLLYLSTSTDNGLTWSTTEIKRPTDKLFGEVIRESNGKPSILLQELSFEAGPLWVLDLDRLSESIPPSNPAIDISANLTGDNHIFLNCPSSLLDSFTISAWICPQHIAQRMGIIDKGGISGNREYRLLLWGVTGPFRYDATKVQVLLGSSTGGWGLMWNSETEVLPGYWTHLVVVFDKESGLVELYRNGELVDSAEYEGGGLIQGSSNAIIGANLDAKGNPENFFYGSLKVKLYNHTLTPNQVVYLYHQFNN